MKRVSHVAIGVRDLDRSLAFYRDLLGMTVIRDAITEPPANRLYDDGIGSTRRRESLLRFGGNVDLDNVFLVLSQSADLAINEPLNLGHIGIHHVGFWVQDVPQLAEQLRAAQVDVVSVSETTGVGYGERAEQPMQAMFVKDPDGTILQFDQRVVTRP